MLTTGDIELQLNSTVSTTDLNNIIGTTSGVQSQLNTKQTLLNNGSDITVNVGRGDVYLENNANDNTDGAGVTLRTNDNPDNGSIFTVRSSGQASRLWVGQNITTTGDNPFYCGYTGNTGSESNTANYKHSLTGTAVTFGTPVTCQYDLQCGDLTANAIYGGAVTQINNAIANAIPKLDYGSISNVTTGGTTTHAVTFNSAFSQPPLVFPNMMGNAAGHNSIDRIWIQDGVTTSGCNIVVRDASSSSNVTLTWFAIGT